MAEIYRARVQGAGGFEKELVVKRILPSRAQDQGFIRMLVNEAKLTVQLTHNNIAQIYECGTIDQNYFIAMELVDGVTLKDMAANFSRTGTIITPEQAIFIVLQLLQGLDYAHKKTDAQGAPLRIVHCDVSPDNTLLSYEGELKLLDFGIARAATGLSNYKEGMLMGKLGYVAPEQASIEQTWDHRVDIFAAGIVLYELLTKVRPFAKATDVESLIASRKTRPPAPTTIDPRLPKDLDVILAQALAYDPEKRYPDARAFADALVDLLFPTPQSAIQDLLGRQMHQVYADRIAKQRTARAHDALVMKVLQHSAAEQGADEKLTDSQGNRPVSLDAPELETSSTGSTSGRLLGPNGTPARGTLRPVTRTVHVGVPVWRAVVLGALVGFLAAGAFIAAEVYFRPGVLVITSRPTGAEVVLDGRPSGTTPAVIENVFLSQKHGLQLAVPGYRTAASQIEPSFGHLVRTLNVDLSSVVGAVAIDSDPPGAQVMFDDKDVGVTPLNVSGIRLDERHRVDLNLSGFELDQFVVLPDKDGQRYTRKLVQRHRPHGAAN